MEASTPRGLSSARAAELLAIHGPNDIEDRDHRGALRTLASILREPMFLLLLLGAAVYLAVGDIGEGLLLSVFAVVSVGLVILQQRRSEHALDALRELSAPQALVMRDGVARHVAVSELVPGDWLVLGEGDRIAADGMLRQGVMLEVDESLLTGESVPVRKRSRPPTVPQLPAKEEGDEGGDESSMLHAGTLVTSGHGLAEVLSTGRDTSIGRIGSSLVEVTGESSPLELQLRRLVTVFGLLAAAVCLAMLSWWGWVRGDWLAGWLAAIALGMAMLPEEFPMALTVFLSIGAWRLARQQVLVRRPASIEALGSVSLLAVDKTGTLTENRMRLNVGVVGEETIDLQAAVSSDLGGGTHRLLESAMMASRTGTSDPIDVAVGDRIRGLSMTPPDQDALEREYPLQPGRPVFAQAWRAGDAGFVVAAKGAPEAVATLCGLTGSERTAVLRQVSSLASQGLRMLAVARAQPALLPSALDDVRFEWLGLLAFADPLRAGVPEAVAEAHRAGVAVAMITGDHAATALAIAREAGIPTQAGALDGSAISAMDEARLAVAVRDVRVFARILPEQKLRLVRAFAASGHVVAMTGDGVNDAPALKAAHVGIAMGRRGSDVAREAATLVLLDDDLSRIVDGVRTGRRIFDNLQRVLVYITAIHVPIAGLALLPVLLGLPPLLLPVHVVLTEMVVDPACSLVFEGAPGDPDAMTRPPRPRDESLLTRGMLLQGLAQGLAVLVAALAVDTLALRAGQGVDAARLLAMLALTAGNLALVAANAGGRRVLLDGSGSSSRRTFWIVCAVAVSAFSAAMTVQPVQALLHFGAVPLGWALVAVVAGIAAALLQPAARWLLRPALRAQRSIT